MERKAEIFTIKERNVTLIIWASAIVLFLAIANPAEGYIGINWGRTASQRMIPSMVVDMLLQNGISELKIFSSSRNVMQAFANSNINVSVSMPNDGISEVKSNFSALYWLQLWVVVYLEQGVNIRYVVVGHEPFSIKFWDKKRNNSLVNENVTDAIVKMNQGLVMINHTEIKITTSHYTDILTDVEKPSEGDFRPDIKDRMIGFLEVLNSTNSPIIFHIHPIDYCERRNITYEYSFFDNGSKYIIKDGDNVYTNLFTFLYDTLVVAMTKAGFPDIKIVIGQIGWPTDGFPNASPENTERFYKGFLPFIASNKGTPLRPNEQIDVYLHNLADENAIKPTKGLFQRHMGVYKFDGVPKYKIDFAGKGRDLFPVPAKGIVLLPKRWCIFQGGQAIPNEEYLNTTAEKYCKDIDCSSLEIGGSCHDLDVRSKVSYIFNVFFQTTNQRVMNNSACNFDGQAQIISHDPSTKKCTFPVQIISAENEIKNGYSSFAASAGNRLFNNRVSSGQSILWFVLSMILCIALR